MENSEVTTEELIQKSEPKKISCLMAGVFALALIVLLALATWLWINRPIKPVELSKQEVIVVEEKISPLEEPAYEKGTNQIILTERELNGLLNQNTELGENLKFTLGTDEIHARAETDLDENFPALGGKKLKARARFLVRMEDGGASLILDDLTVWGVSIPNDWLAGIKGENLLRDIFGGTNGFSGIEDLKVEPGRLVIRLAK